jgi:hypothetical protein
MHEPSHPCPVSVGETATVYGTVAVDNDVGGTCLVEHDGAGIETVVTRTFWDYETGWVIHGKVVSDETLAEIRRQATTGLAPEQYRRYETANPGIVARTEQARAGFDPSILKFSEHDLRGPAPGIVR